MSVINNNKVFNFEKYKVNITNQITSILSQHNHNNLTYDIMDTKKLKQNKIIALKEKQRQMKVGKIMQIVLGNYDKFIDLGEGDETGLDIISKERKIIIELKNRTNTDNDSSRKSNLDKLAKFKNKNPDYTCIYGCINDTTEKKTKNGKIDIIQHNGVELKLFTGNKLLEFILGDDMNETISYVKDLIDRLT
jgi:hypothetical protein